MVMVDTLAHVGCDRDALALIARLLDGPAGLVHFRA